MTEANDLAALSEKWSVSLPLKQKSYFLLAPALGLVKIGCSINPTQRMCDLRTMNAAETEPLLVLRVPELELHERFKLSRHHGEWFRVTFKMVHYLRDISEDDAADRLYQVICDAP